MDSIMAFMQSKLVKKQREDEMAAGFFVAHFRDADDTGGIGLYIGNGIIVGVDNGLVRYDGQYNQLPDGSLEGVVHLRARQPTQLITGDILQPGFAAPISFRLPPNFASGQIFQFNLGGHLVATKFEKLRDLP